LNIKIFTILGILALTSACSNLQKNEQTQCDHSMSLLDNVCVHQEVADYVSCVRAHGSELTNEQSDSLSAEAGYFAITAQGASEVRSSLKRKYAVSEKSMMLIIDQCKEIVSGVKAPQTAILNTITQYANPRVEGYALDICREWGENCGKPAADSFCKINGHASALQYKIQLDSPPTKVISSGSICKKDFCDRINYVVCQ